MQGQQDTSHKYSATRRHAQLLGALLCFHLVGPAVQSIAPRLATLVLFPLYAIVLGAAAVAVPGARRRLILGLLALPMIVAVLAVAASDSPQPLALPAMALPFLAYTLCVLFRGILAPGAIDQAQAARLRLSFHTSCASVGRNLRWPGVGRLPFVCHGGRE
jgi:ABC-type transport system involved in cytochrome c biogenesis permease component